MRLLPYRVGPWSWIISGGGHLIIQALLQLSPKTTGAHALMRTEPFAAPGVQRTVMQVVLGVSVAMGVAVVTAGVLMLLIARLTADVPERARTAGILALLVSVGLLSLSAVMLPPPPIITNAVAVVAFATALFPRRTAVAAAP